ncbi:MAG: SCP2 sterol-binding domain-containing protein [Magnetococcales bacterium]|nr:SCP2 sterol-binding domain-containing protein [Magnetococcales bacterium]
MPTRLLALPLKLLPQPFTAVSLGITLNLFFSRYPALKERLSELGGKIFEFDVEDLGKQFYMRVEDNGGILLHTYCDDDCHVTMAGESTAFLDLLTGQADPDSLFFSRRLKLSGETDTGLRFKNLLDNVEIDWEKEMASVVGGPMAGVLDGWRKQTFAGMQQGRKIVEAGVERWVGNTGLPRKGELEPLHQAVEVLGETLGRLEARASRLEKRLALQSKAKTPNP